MTNAGFLQSLFVIVLVGLLIQGLQSHLGEPPPRAAQHPSNVSVGPGQMGLPGGQPFAVAPPNHVVPAGWEPTVEAIVDIRNKLQQPSVASILGETEQGEFENQLARLAGGQPLSPAPPLTTAAPTTPNDGRGPESLTDRIKSAWRHLADFIDPLMADRQR